MPKRSASMPTSGTAKPPGPHANPIINDDTVAALAGAHRNFEMRVYNPVLGRARFGYPMYAVATLCCFRRLNQRMQRLGEFAPNEP